MTHYVTPTYEPAAPEWPLEPGDPLGVAVETLAGRLMTCTGIDASPGCGALVVDTDRHTAWHERVDGLLGERAAPRL